MMTHSSQQQSLFGVCVVSGVKHLWKTYFACATLRCGTLDFDVEHCAPPEGGTEDRGGGSRGVVLYSKEGGVESREVKSSLSPRSVEMRDPPLA